MRAAIALFTVASTGCAPTVMPDFTLVDTNVTSATSGQSVSVSDQRGGVSAWYFGHST